jgi:cytochrome c6
MNSIEALTYQISNGKNGMPAFGDRLTQNEIQDIGQYILVQSLKNFEN